jgi:CBS domain-containing protein
MLRYPPHERLGTLLDQGLEPVTTDTSAAEVSRILASYNLVSVPVVDENHRLVGVVTIDDVLDYLLPDDWRSHDEDQPLPPRERARQSAVTTVTAPIAIQQVKRNTTRTRRTGNGQS